MKRGVELKNIVVIVFSFLIFFSPIATLADAYDDYWKGGQFSWKDDSTIVHPKATFKKKTCSNAAQDQDCRRISSYLYSQTDPTKSVYASTDTQSIEGNNRNSYIVVENGSTANGTLYSVGPGMVTPETSITISSTTNAPTAKKSLGTGVKINGLMTVSTRDRTGEPVNKDLILKELNIALYDEQGKSINLIDFEWDLNTTDVKYFAYADKSNYIYKWNQMTIKSELYTNTTYSIRSNVPDDKYVDCITGEVKNFEQNQICTLKYHGRVDFQIKDDNTIQIVGNADTYEASTRAKIPMNSAQEGLRLTVVEELNSPLDKALSNMISNLADWVSTSLTFVMGAIDSLLNNSEEIVLGRGIEGAWTKIRNVALTLLVFALIVIAFANTLSIDIEKYGLNRMIPKIIISIIMAFGSWILVMFFFDMANAIQAQSFGLMGGENVLDMLKDTRVSTPTSADIVGKIGAIITLIVICVLVLFCGVILLFSLLLRIVMLAFLLAVAPLAFLLNILPFTDNLYKQWWNNFFKWLFMAPIAVAIIALGSLIANGTGFRGGVELSADHVTNPDSLNILIGLIVFAASLVMAASLPLQWGGKLMGSWQKVGKNVWGKTGGSLSRKGLERTGLPGAWNKYWKAKGLTHNTKVEQASGRLLEKAPFLNNTEKQNARKDLAAAYTAQYGNAQALDMNKAFKRAESRGDLTMMQAIATAAKNKYNDFGFLYANESDFDHQSGSFVIKPEEHGNDTNMKQRSLSARLAAAKSGNLYNAMKRDRDFRNYIKDNDVALAMDMAFAHNDDTLLRDIGSSNGGQTLEKKDKNWIAGLTGEEIINGEKVEGGRIRSLNAKAAANIAAGRDAKYDMTAIEREAYTQASKLHDDYSTADSDRQKKFRTGAHDKLKGAFKTFIQEGYGETPWHTQPTAAAPANDSVRPMVVDDE